MANAKNQVFENKAVNKCIHNTGKEKKGAQNEGITLNVAEIKGDTKLTWLKITLNLEC